jgi:hypothetical protein
MPDRSLPGLSSSLRAPRTMALVLITVLVAVSAILQVDVLVAVGELALFVALADGWAVRSRIAAWTVTLAGLAVSVAGNVGHIASAAMTARLNAAIPPFAAAAALAVGLGVLKRVVGISRVTPTSGSARP